MTPVGQPFTPHMLWPVAGGGGGGVHHERIWLVLLTASATTQFYSSTKQPTFAFGANISFPREPTHTLVL